MGTMLAPCSSTISVLHFSFAEFELALPLCKGLEVEAFVLS